MRKIITILLAAITLSFISIDLLGQSIEDTLKPLPTTEKVKKGSIFSGRPGKSMLLSLAVPGAGQIYNKSYLRVPFVWAAVGGMGWVLVHNSRQYNCYRDGYIALVDETPFNLPNHCLDDNNDDDIADITQIDEARMKLIRDEANKYRQLSIVGFTLVWLANGVDAFVDAHLKEFDIDEDLSIDIGPKMDNDPYAPMRLGVFVQF